MQMLTTALAMMSQGGASVDESQVEAIVERKLKSIKPTKVEVVSATATKRVEMAHKNFADAVALVGMGKNIALIGEAGSGKSFGAIQMAQALDLDYVVESCHGKMQSFDLVGAISPTTVTTSAPSCVMLTRMVRCSSSMSSTARTPRLPLP